MRGKDGLAVVLAATFLGGAIAAAPGRAVASGVISPPTIATITGHVGDSYEASLSFPGAAAWSVTSGQLPPGLVLSSGQIAGVPTQAGSYTFVVRASAPGDAAADPYTILVHPADSSGYDARMAEVLLDRDVTPSPADCNHTGYLTYAIADLWLDQDTTLANNQLASLKLSQIGGTPQSCGAHIDESRNNLDLAYLIRAYMLYDSASSYFPGRLTAGAQSNLLAQIYAYARPYSHLNQAPDTWSIFDSENHDAQAESFDFLAAQIFKDTPGYSGKRYADGSTVAQQYKAWHDHWSNYFDERAKHGFFIESGAPGYHGYTVQAILNIYNFADDPVLRKKAGMILDLDFADYAQQELNDIWGGPKSRSFPTDSLDGGNDSMTDLGKLLFGPASTTGADNHVLMLATSGYSPPLVVQAMATNRAAMSSFAYITRRPGVGGTSPDTSDDWHVTPSRSVLDYSYVTPNYIMGTTELWPNDTHIAPSSQNRWQGITFNEGPGVRIYPQAAPSHVNVCNDAFLSIESRSTLITEKRTTGRGITAGCGTHPTLVYFPASLDSIVEQHGWLFVTEGPTYVAIKPAIGTYKWLTPAKNQAPVLSDRFIQLSNASSPIIFEAAPASAFAGPDTFRSRILATPLTYAKGVLKYKSLDTNHFTFFHDTSQAPSLNGHIVNYSPSKLFDSPYFSSTFGSGKFTVSFAGQRATYDFSHPNNPVKSVS